MRLSGRRNSNNIEDRRGISGKSLGIGGGIVGIIIVGIITLLQGGSVGDVLSNVIGAGGGQTLTANEQYVETEEDARLADLTSKVLAGTEDVWTEEFRRQGWGEYRCRNWCFSTERCVQVAATLRLRPARSIAPPTRLSI